ncbi:MAG: hypothetical protein LBJ95_05240 [Oscillospiraceae bacterium]|jgi:hypothetical protein|nr:hypothetical protein [Oscillospiraceae bacterium]
MLKIQTEEQLLSKTNLNNSEVVELSLKELEQVNGGAPGGLTGPIGHCDNCGNDLTILVCVTRNLPDRPWLSSGFCLGCAVNRIMDYLRSHPEMIDAFLKGTVSAAFVASIIGAYVLPGGPLLMLCKAVRDAIAISRECTVA